MEGEEALRDRESGDRGGERHLLDKERRKGLARTFVILSREVKTLPYEDRLIIKLWIWGERKVADIARDLHLEQRPLYPRIGRILARLRQAFRDAELDDDDIRGLLGDDPVQD